ncbi:MAG: glycogen debranching enzyme N-terminal domain-containing protein, partial [Lentisphaeria bacterium]
MNIRFNADACRHPRFLQGREWLETNGRGGYASSTLANCHTRKYHGLLVANLGEPANGRHVLLSKFEEVASGAGGDTLLTTTQFPGAVVPAVPPPLAAFELAEYPVWTFALPHGELRRGVLMPQGRDTVLLRFAYTGDAAPLTLRFRPFLAYRRFHELMRENAAVSAAVHGTADGFRVAPYDGMPPLVFQSNLPMRWTPAGAWYRDFEYLEEHGRGYPFREDLFVPACFEVTLPPGAELVLAAGTEPLPDLAAAWAGEKERRQKERRRALELAHVLAPGPEEVAVTERLILAGGQLLIQTPGGRPACLAGYHWFEDWGRDTMIALPGVAFHAGRLDH